MTITLPKDPRWFQIAALSTLLTGGTLWLGLEFRWSNSLVIVATALGVQWIGNRALRQPFDPRSALITSLSLTLLLRAASPPWAIAAAALAIGSKFVVRARGKHIFNPANFSIVLLMLCTDEVWVSSGQWGSALLGATVMAALGLLVLSRARYAETALSFLAVFTLLAFARALWLGDPLALALHQLSNGALLVFTFFMISDPKTAPDRALGRCFYGALVAAVAFSLEVVWFVTAAPVWALAFLAPCVPVIDALWQGPRYRWARPATTSLTATKGGNYA
ncbi:MAG: RnfABCDGE type electron transport complex subunit D [Pseudomonadota bacterium]